MPILLILVVLAVGHAKHVGAFGGPESKTGQHRGISIFGGNAPATSRNADSYIRVATFNVHYVIPGSHKDEITAWEPREAAVLDVVRQVDADIIAYQEMETFSGGHSNAVNIQRESLERAFPQFDFAATGDPAVFPNTQPIMYREDRFSVIDEGFFFFSPTPDVIYSEPWFGRYPSFATWVRFRDNAAHASANVLVFNVHIDRERYRDKVLSARLLTERINAIRSPSDRIVVLGDFNALRSSRIVRIVTTGAGLEVVSGGEATFHFNRGLHLFPAIDHVLYGDAPGTAARLHPLQGGPVRVQPDGIWPSDHYPVVIEFGTR